MRLLSFGQIRSFGFASFEGLSFPSVVCLRGHPFFGSFLRRWRLQETSGTIAYDCSRNGTHPGTYTGGMTLGYAGRGTGNAAAVSALSDGSSGFVLLPTLPGVQSGGPFSAGGYSMEAWAYTTGVSGYKRFFTASSGAAGTYYDMVEFGWRSVTTLVPYAQFTNSIGNGIVMPALTSPSYSSWHHIVVRTRFCERRFCERRDNPSRRTASSGFPSALPFDLPRVPRPSLHSSRGPATRSIYTLTASLMPY